jgi:hypothetical protein
MAGSVRRATATSGDKLVPNRPQPDAWRSSCVPSVNARSKSRSAPRRLRRRRLRWMLIQRSNQMAVLDSEQLLNERMLALKRRLRPSANGITSQAHTTLQAVSIVRGTRITILPTAPAGRRPDEDCEDPWPLLWRRAGSRPRVKPPRCSAVYREGTRPEGRGLLLHPLRATSDIRCCQRRPMRRGSH